MIAVRRVKQGVRALLSFRETPDLNLAAQYLNVQQLALFRAMPRLEQIHALNVLRSLMTLGLPPDADDRALDDLAVAALLHDAGKSLHRVRVWQKTLPVLVKAASSDLYDKLSRRDPRHLLWRGFAVKARHPEWGAQLAGGANTTERALWLIAHHQDAAELHTAHPDAAYLRLLQTADDAN